MLSCLWPAHVDAVLDACTCITAHDCVKVGITIDKQLTINDHISLCCSRAARHLTAFTRIPKYLNQNYRHVIHHSIIGNNCKYYPLVCNFCCKSNNITVEKNDHLVWYVTITLLCMKVCYIILTYLPFVVY